MTGFKATLCASTGDNRHNCASTRWEKTKEFYLANYQVGANNVVTVAI